MATEVMPFMKCGHQANARDANGKPICVICTGLKPEASEVAAEMSGLLAGRWARCSCMRLMPSTDALMGKLAFFEYRGEGSNEATNYCRDCGYARSAHTRKEEGESVTTNVCNSFTPKGALQYDSFYCGHAGWD